MNDAFDFRDIVSFCFVVDSHPCLHLFRFERLRLCWCKVRQVSGGGAEVCLRWYCTLIETLSQRWHYCEFFLFRPWLTIFLFWNIALTFKLRQVPPRYSGLQSLLSCPHGVVIHARWERMAWRNWYDERWEGWNGGKGMHSNFEKSPPRYSGFQSLFSCQHGKLWFVRGGRGWHGGISMNDEKDGILEKACTVWNALGQELRLCLEITKIIRTQNPCANGPTKLLLFSVQA